MSDLQRWKPAAATSEKVSSQKNHFIIGKSGSLTDSISHRCYVGAHLVCALKTTLDYTNKGKGRQQGSHKKGRQQGCHKKGSHKGCPYHRIITGLN